MSFDLSAFILHWSSHLRVGKEAISQIVVNTAAFHKRISHNFHLFSLAIFFEKLWYGQRVFLLSFCCQKLFINNGSDFVEIIK